MSKFKNQLKDEISSTSFDTSTSTQEWQHFLQQNYQISWRIFQYNIDSHLSHFRRHTIFPPQHQSTIASIFLPSTFRPILSIGPHNASLKTSPFSVAKITLSTCQNIAYSRGLRNAAKSVALFKPRYETMNTPVLMPSPVLPYSGSRYISYLPAPLPDANRLLRVPYAG